MHILIFGASGLLGKSLLFRLIRDMRISKITVAVHRTPINPTTLSEKVVPVPMSAVFSEKRGTGTYDAVICLTGASYSQTSNESAMREANLDVPLRVIQYCREHQIRHMIFASSINARLTQCNGYAAYKSNVERNLANSRVSYTVFRPPLLFGNGDPGFSKLVKYISKHTIVPVFGNGKKLEQPMHFDEAAAFFHEAVIAEPANRIFEIGGLNAMTYNDMLMEIAKSVQRKVRLLHVPAAPLITMLRFFERMGMGLPIHSEQVMHIDTDLAIDNTEALSRYPVTLRSFPEHMREYAV